ncbi:FIS1 (YIL065C) [Zygosaccharomyces parabailii]|uniref:Mitochondrial fission 1 protein n=1 Tax=Zygosaccharomyces bailii (strain CLIB 213 / ATCC 58445 / CBS 680 / BCRC 21525 / NBRC 1098 / NCYC 1416 / NRRL Y-2227) TaxID=1333698 RepID=A0A8J2X8C5_ZYGB2|nr:FIS1 (YIL065C) [Zygosaccharomyces parabailii]CDF89383.1 ZYBA0S04-02982g1_1 [Zygosaccharomyces bailii CLIB 213]CDH08342.1 probable Mitochondria fission 1 protein [Zygosaccharomyces bailii ISA1307]SJM85781.1 probable Mitochondria fission 1 protein [Zygosaccharomyces bailii]
MPKINFLPTLQDSFEPLLPQQVEILRQQFLSEGGETASIQSRFNYAWGLIKSVDADDQRLGIKLLTDIYKESPQRRRECLYYLTIGCYKVGEYSMAKRYVDTLLQHEPANQQIKALQSMVEDKIQRETVKGVAVATGVVAGVAAVAAFLLRGRKK